MKQKRVLALDLTSLAIIQLLGAQTWHSGFTIMWGIMTGTEVVRQVIWLQDVIDEIIGSSCEKVVIRIDN